MKQILVLNELENGKTELVEIDAGVTSYSELEDAPINTTYKGVLLRNSTVSLKDGALDITPQEGHKWDITELNLFCAHAEDGRYDVLTAERGYEIIFIDSTDEYSGRHYRRMSTSVDEIWIAASEDWAPITDTNAEALIYKFINADDIPSSMVVGDELILEFYYYSTFGTARVNVTVNGSSFTAGTVKSREKIYIDLTKYIKDGQNNIKVNFDNGCGDPLKGNVPAIEIIGVQANFTPNFNQYYPFSSDVLFEYSCSASSKKIVYVTVTNAEGNVSTLSKEHREIYAKSSIRIPTEKFSQGVNYIEAYMVAYDPEDDTKPVAETNVKRYTIPFLTNDEPLLMVYYDQWEGLKQYASLSVPYYVYKRVAGTAAITSAGNLKNIHFAIESNGLDKEYVYVYTENDGGEPSRHLQYNVEHTWNVGSLPTTTKDGVDYPATIIIYGEYLSGSDSLTTNTFIQEGVSIKPSTNTMQPIDTYEFGYNANDLIGAMDVWEGAGSMKTTMNLHGFNWTTDGIQADRDGDMSLHFSSSASADVTLPSSIFSSQTTPFMMEFIFRADAAADVNTPIIKMYNPSSRFPGDQGIFIYPTKAIFKYGSKSTTIDYNAGDKIQLAYTVLNDMITDEDLTNPGTEKTGSLLYLLTYINGIVSKMEKLETNFPTDCLTIEINKEAKTNVDLYALRGYGAYLTTEQVLQNYISSFSITETKTTMYEKNNIHSSSVFTGVPGEREIVFSEELLKQIPCYFMMCDQLPRTKDYVKCLSVYYDKNGETFVEPGNYVSKLKQDLTGIPKATTYYYYREKLVDDEGKEILDNNGDPTYGPWKRNKPIEVGGQGTSSLAYSRHNFKFKHNKSNPFYIKGHTHGPDRTFTFKADYMDSSGANNICNAQILDDAIVRNLWKSTHTIDGTTEVIETPAAQGARVNLDGFPVAVFWCRTKDMKGGVMQRENAADEDIVYDDKGKPLYDIVTPVPGNEQLGTVTPKDPVYIGTFNFNYDKKAKKLLGWNEDDFQGFEFRGNSSKCNLFQGFENFSAFTSLRDGFEWRWTYCSDYIDDYHDKNLGETIDGGFVKEIEDGDQVKIIRATETEYLAGNADKIPAFNQYFVNRDDRQLQLVWEKTPGTFVPVNYVTINPANANWWWQECQSISDVKNNICLEYALKIGTKDNVLSLLYQPPYGLSTEVLGKAYKDGSHYYEFEWNKEHEFKFNVNKTHAKFIDDQNQECDYYNDNEFWNTVAPLDNIKAMKVDFIEDENGEYTYHIEDEDYYMISSFPADAKMTEITNGKKYTKVIEYLDLQEGDEIITWNFMQHVMKNWCYVNEAVAHIEDGQEEYVLSNNQYTEYNGWGLFVWDSLFNYLCTSMITGLCDNFAKNMFMHSYDGGISWSPAWYDMDTCFGLDNQGNYAKLYDIDFLDYDIFNERGFNGSNSRLWQIIYNKFHSKVKEMYKIVRDENYISYDKIMKVVYDQNIAYKTEALYNANWVYRYVEPLVWHNNARPDAAQGDRLSLLKYWNKKRQVYLDSKYEGIGWTQDVVNLRLSNTHDVDLELVPDTNMYLGANFNASPYTVPSVKSTEKILAGETWKLRCPSEGSATNINTYLYGAGNLLELGDLSECNSTEIKIETAYNLRKLKIGDEVHPPRSVLAVFNLSTTQPYYNLKEMDFTNVTFKNTLLSLLLGSENLTPALEVLKLKGSNITEIQLKGYTPLRELSLPVGLIDLTLVDFFMLEDLYVPDGMAPRSLTIANCNKLNQYDIAKRFMGKIMNISLDNLIVPEDNAATPQFMNWLVSMNASLTGGEMYIEGRDEASIQKYRDRWPDVNIYLKQVFEKDVVFGVTGEDGIEREVNEDGEITENIRIA